MRLTATDAGGLQAAQSVRLNPKTSELTVQSRPAGLQLAVGSEAVQAPATRTVITGSRASISAPSPQTLAGVTYVFSGWSDGGEQTHTVTAAANMTVTATFAVGSGPLDTADRVIHAAHASARSGTWRIVANGPAASNARIEQPNLNAARWRPRWRRRRTSEARFQAEANRPYRIWIRGRAAGNSYNNDSVYAQFSGWSIRRETRSPVSGRPAPFRWLSKSATAAGCPGGAGRTTATVALDRCSTSQRQALRPFALKGARTESPSTRSSCPRSLSRRSARAGQE